MYKRPNFHLVLVLFVLCGFRGSAETKEKESTTELVWRHAAGGALLGLPAVQAGTVVAVLDGGHLQAYSLEGKPLWDYYAKSPRLIPFVSRNREGTSYICRSDGTLIAINRVGRELWQLKPGPITAPVISGWDGRIFVTTEKRIFCYTASGYSLWNRELADKTVSGPFLTGKGGIVAALADGELLELDPFGKAQSRPIGEIPAAIIPVHEGTLALLKNGSVKLFHSDSLAQDRNVIKLQGSPLGGISRENEAAILLANGSVVLVSLSSGKQKWSGTSHIKAKEVTTADDFVMQWDERGIYVFSRGGATGFNYDGKRLWTLALNGASSIPVLGDEGTLISGGMDWIIYAYRVESRRLSLKQSLYGPAPEGKYGLYVSSPVEDYFGFNEAHMAKELRILTNVIKEGQVGENEPVYAAYLREIAGSAMSPQTSKTHPRVHVRFRAEAARILGYIGSRETIPFLANLYLKDTDPVVRAAAAEAIGRIGYDPEGIALQAFEQTIYTVSRDAQILTAAASAIGSLCRFSGPPLSESGLRLLVIMQQEFMPAMVRSQARHEIASLR